jgi:hypothetical protein
MQSSEPGPEPDPQSVTPRDEVGPMSTKSTPPTPDGRDPRSLWAWTLTAALIAGLASWSIGERTLDYFQASEAAMKNLSDPGPMRRELAVFVPRNVAIAYGTLGALLGSMMGLAGGLVRGSIARGFVAFLIGGLAGAAAGAALSFALVPVFLTSFDPGQPSMLLMIGVRGGIWAATGAIAGLALGLGLGHFGNVAATLLGGLLGGLTGTVAFELGNALVNALDRNDQVHPTTSASRLLAYMSVSLLAAIGVIIAARGRLPQHRGGAPKPLASDPDLA